LLEPLGALVAEASARSQVVVVTHAERLSSALEGAGALTHRLEAHPDGTRIAGQGTLDRPAWHWGSR
ncbi:MAG: AAA family ATPase, partial [Microbacterium sp.]